MRERQRKKVIENKEIVTTARRNIIQNCNQAITQGVMLLLNHAYHFIGMKNREQSFMFFRAPPLPLYNSIAALQFIVLSYQKSLVILLKRNSRGEMKLKCLQMRGRERGYIKGHTHTDSYTERETERGKRNQNTKEGFKHSDS